jgi:hypothetical protein
VAAARLESLAERRAARRQDPTRAQTRQVQAEASWWTPALLLRVRRARVSESDRPEQREALLEQR